MIAKKEVIIFIGPNGAGKSTLARQLLTDEQLQTHIDPDAYGQERFGLNQQTELVAKQSTEQILAYAQAGINFSFETVGSSTIKRELITRLQSEFGYRLVFHYCVLANDCESISRVTQRVRLGGHSVPLEKLIERFPKILANIPFYKSLANEWHVWQYGQNWSASK